jgi:hypothetical protein
VSVVSSAIDMPTAHGGLGAGRWAAGVHLLSAISEICIRYMHDTHNAMHESAIQLTAHAHPYNPEAGRRWEGPWGPAGLSPCGPMRPMPTPCD